MKEDTSHKKREGQKKVEKKLSLAVKALMLFLLLLLLWVVGKGVIKLSSLAS
ncbi:MAG: hypothetical protein V2I56_17305 [Desulfobacteraceae bacterium]|nr:hypothetical protein [Desulfobacteraceae bacterium]